MKNKGLDAFVVGLRIAMKDAGWRMKPLSLAAGMGESGVRDFYRNGSVPKVSNAYAIAQVLGRTVDEIIQLGLSDGAATSQVRSRSIPVVGRVGAGAEIELVDAYAKGDGLFHGKLTTSVWGWFPTIFLTWGNYPILCHSIATPDGDRR